MQNGPHGPEETTGPCLPRQGKEERMKNRSWNHTNFHPGARIPQEAWPTIYTQSSLYDLEKPTSDLNVPRTAHPWFGFRSCGQLSPNPHPWGTFRHKHQAALSPSCALPSFLCSARSPCTCDRCLLFSRPEPAGRRTPPGSYQRSPPGWPVLDHLN